MGQVYVQLCKLTDLWKDDARWQANVQASGVAEGYTWAVDEDDWVTAELNMVELQLAEQVTVYDFMGSMHEEERFYPRDMTEHVVLQDSEGKLWVRYVDNMEAF